MAFVALVTLLLLIQYTFFAIKAGQARDAANIEAPAMSGDDTFERALRVQLNTLEQLVVTVPAMWLCAYYASATFAGLMGIVFLVGRHIYRKAYIADPSTRGTGMMTGFIANALMILIGFFGVLGALF